MTTRQVLLAFALLGVALATANYGIVHDFIGGDSAYTWALPWETFHYIGGLLTAPGLGVNRAMGFPTVTLYAIFGSIAAITGSTIFTARLLVGTMLFACYAGAYILTKQLLDQRTTPFARDVGAFAAAAIYGANHYTAFLFSSAVNDMAIPYLTLPWIASAFISAAEGQVRRALVICSVIFITCSSFGSNPAHFVTVLMVIGAVILSTGFAPATCGRTLRNAIPLLALCLGLSAWWIFPDTTAFASNATSVGNFNITGWLHWMSEKSSFARLFKLGGYTGDETLPYAWWYRSWLGNLLGYWPAFLAVIGLGRRRPIFSCAFFALGLIGIWMSKGTHEPLGASYAWMINHILGFSMFRSPYDKWIVLTCLAFATLGGFGASVVVEAAAVRINRRAVCACIIAPLLLYPLPQYCGKLLNYADTPTRFLSTIPAEYVGAANLTRTAPGRTITFGPPPPPEYTQFDWHYFGSDPLEPLVEQGSTPILQLIPDASALSPHALAQRLRDFGVGWIIVHLDLQNPISSPNILDLVRDKEVKEIAAFQSLAVYRLNGQPAPLARVIRHIALASSDSINDFSGNTDLDRASFALASSGIADVALRSPRGSFGSSIGATFVPAWVKTNIAWPLIEEPVHCNGKTGTMLSPPTIWTIAGRKLSPDAQLFCTTLPTVGGLQIDGNDVGTGLLSLTPGMHLARQIVVDPRGTAAVRPLFIADGLATGVFSVSTPITQLNMQRQKACEGGTTVVTTPTANVETTLNISTIDFPKTLMPGTPVLITTMNPSGCAQWPFNSIDTLLQQTITQKFIASRGTIARFSSLPAAFNAKQTVLKNVSLTSNGAIRDWSPVITNDETSRIQSHIKLDTSSRYRITIDYSADRDVAFTIDSDRTSQYYHLMPDIHGRFSVNLSPPIDTNGHITLTFDMYSTRTTIHHVRLESIGPNGIWATIVQPHDTPAIIQKIERFSPSRLNLHVRDCTPCTLRVDVGDPTDWEVVGARVLAAGIGPGDSSIWRLDAGAGQSTIRLMYKPMLLAQQGLLIAILAATAGFIWWLRSAHANIVEGDRENHALGARASAVRVVTLLLLALGAIVSTFLPESAFESTIFDTLFAAVTALCFMATRAAMKKQSIVTQAHPRYYPTIES
jgi:hypothetical protein